MKSFFKHSRKGFTMVELMIVIAIIGILMMVSVFPYGDYMKRAQLSNMVDTISQEWVLAHKEIRNGREFDATQKNHASIVFKFTKGENKIEKYLFSGSTLDTFESTKKLDKDISFDGKISLLSLDGAANDKTFTSKGDELYYLITPPYGTGAFFDKNFVKLSPENSHKIIIGLPGANNTVSQAKEILLRTYLQ